MIRDQFLLAISHELIVDNFAGGGGASGGIGLALGRHVDIAKARTGADVWEQRQPTDGRRTCVGKSVEACELIGAGGKPDGGRR